MLVHCERGIGRTGTMAVAYWIARGLPVAEATARIRKAPKGASERADHASGDGRLEPERIPDRYDQLTNAQDVGLAEDEHRPYKGPIDGTPVLSPSTPAPLPPLLPPGTAAGAQADPGNYSVSSLTASQ